MIVCIGEGLIDIRNGKYFVGGGPLNTALAAARAGSPVLFLGSVSSDEWGQKILDHMVENCIFFDPDLCNNPCFTMTAEVAVDASGEAEYSFKYKGSSAFSFDENYLEKALKECSNIRYVFTGSVSFTNANSRQTIIKTLDTIPESVVYFDPNIRPFVIDDMPLYLQSITEFAGRSDIVRVSNEDLELWNLTREELLAVSKEHLIVTEGDKSSTWYVKSTGLKVCADAVKPSCIVDTIGCGDTFNGSVLHCLHKRGSIENLSEQEISDILKFASLCSSLNCTQEGCNPPFINDSGTEKEKE